MANAAIIIFRNSGPEASPKIRLAVPVRTKRNARIPAATPEILFRKIPIHWNRVTAINTQFGVDDTHIRKAKFCSVLNHSCVQFTGSESTSAYLKKVAEEAAERKKKAAKKAAEHKTKAAEGAAKASA